LYFGFGSRLRPTDSARGAANLHHIADLQTERRDGSFMAGTGFPRGSPQADFSRQGPRFESQFPGAVSYSHWRTTSCRSRTPGIGYLPFCGAAWQGALRYSLIGWLLRRVLRKAAAWCWPVNAMVGIVRSAERCGDRAQVLWRTISSKPRSTQVDGGDSPRISVSSIPAAAVPISARGVRTVVSGGSI
jgi:hypothetical protein